MKSHLTSMIFAASVFCFPISSSQAQDTQVLNQTSQFSNTTRELSFPILTVRGQGIFENLVLAPVAGVNGAWTYKSNAVVMRLDKWYKLRPAVDTAKCLEGGFINQESHYLGTCNTTGQLWRILERPETTSEVFYYLNPQSYDSTVCLGNNGASPNLARVSTCNGLPGQEWRFVPGPPGFYTIQNPTPFAQTACLTALPGGSQVTVSTCSNSNTQLWLMDPADQPKTVNFSGAWYTGCPTEGDCGPMFLSQVGNTVTGTFGSNGQGSLSGTVSGNTLTGTWRRWSSSNSFRFTLNASGTSWQGIHTDTNCWNGARLGTTLPAC
jgi:hypothetical protein